MMGRVRKNLERLVEVLKKKKYPFAAGSAKKALPGPDTKTAKALDEMEKILGTPLPISLRAFYEVVGPVSLVENGEPPRAPNARFFAVYGAFNPIAVTPPSTALEQLREQQKDSAGFAPELRPRITRVYLGPDPAYKEDPRGAGDDASYELDVDGQAADGEVHQGDQSMPFVDYLRRVVAAGGFLTLPDQPEEDTHKQREALTKGSLRF